MSTVAFSTSEAIQFLCISVESENVVVSLRLLTTDIRSKLRLEIAVKEFYHSRLFVSQNGLKFFSLAWMCLLVLAFTKTDIKPALGWFSNTPKQRKKISFQRSGLFFYCCLQTCALSKLHSTSSCFADDNCLSLLWIAACFCSRCP